MSDNYNNTEGVDEKIGETIGQAAKREVKKSFKLLFKILLPIIVLIILLVSFLWLIFGFDTKDGKKGNVKKWVDVAGPLPNTKVGGSISGRGGTVVEKAIECHKYLRDRKYTYGGGYSIPDGIYNHNIVDCSAFVSWVLYEVGCDSFKTYQETEFVSRCSSGAHPELVEIKNKNEVQPGDVLVYRAYGGHSGHVELAAQVDNGKVVKVYNCGSDSSISSEGDSQYPETSAPSRDIAGYADNKIYRLK